MKKVIPQNLHYQNIPAFRITLLIVIGMFFAQNLAFAQKIKCLIRVNIENLPIESQQNLAYLQEELDTYINNYEWTEDEFGYDINCEMELAFTERKTVSYEDRYTATIIISNGIDLLYADKRCSFALEKNESLRHSSSHHPFTAVIDFYVNLILAYEYDKLYKFGGDKYYQLCEETNINAKTVSQFYKGWDRRSDLLRDLKGKNNKKYRELMYNYSTGYFYFSVEKDFEQSAVYLKKAVELLKMIPSERLDRFMELNYANFKKALKRMKMNSDAQILESVKASVK